MPKQRKVFAMRNFLGLDKENKALKVAPFRASDGYNFQIDSQTLKTREGFVIDSNVGFSLGTNEVIIGWYQYKGGTLYVSTANLYFVFNNTTYSIHNSTSSFVYQSGLPETVNFTGKRPIFKEEKNALFIFGLGFVFVFSVFFSDTAESIISKIIFYDLKAKQSNPFTLGDSFDKYDDLPTPYEPTLFIGDEPFDDVNLLSNVSKYRLFAKTTEGTEYSKYYLPTHYNSGEDATKDFGTFDIANNLDITFYDGLYDGLTVFPVFLGITGDNFTYNTSTHGLLENTAAISIEETWYPESNFEYYDNSGADVFIKKEFGLTKEKFFLLKILRQDQNVFEFLLNYIKNNIDQDSFSANKVFKFSLPYQVKKIKRDSTDQTKIIETTIEEANVEVLVQLRKFESTGRFFDSAYDAVDDNSNFQVTPEQLTSTTNNLYPGYPTAQTSVHSTITLANPRESDIEDLAVFARETLKQEFINDIAGDPSGTTYQDQRLFEYRGKFFYDKKVIGQDAYTTLNVKASEVTSTANVGTATFPSYETNFAYNNLNQITVNQISEDAFYSYPFDEEKIASDLIDYIITNDSFSDYKDTSQEFFVKYQIKGYSGLNTDGTLSQSGSYHYASRIAKIDFVVGAEAIIRRKISANIRFRVFDTAPNTSGSLYNFRFNPSKNWFELELRDFFFDYNLEPSIEVKVTFNKNPNYDLIAKSTFGVLFGSEDRLFLAGHPDYPNVDRYNVSNDLLGDNVVNQSFELSYFPSKNYRVLGGKGAINGYIEATDTQLYVTKEEYPGDSKLFIRERFLDEKGLAGYKEFKTNILETPINNRCVVRFYNDILMLTKNGLYGVEIASNVLTNERLLKLRSGYINKHLKSIIATAISDGKEIYIVENNQMMYIFIGLDVFVADSRYISKNENSEIENLSYELIQWKTKEEYFTAKFESNELYVIGKNKEVKLKLVETTDEDFVADFKSNVFSQPTDNTNAPTAFQKNFFTIGGSDAETTYNGFAKSSVFVTQTNSATQIFAKVTNDYTFNQVSSQGNTVTFTIQNAPNSRFAKVQTGDRIYFLTTSGARVNVITTVSQITTNSISFAIDESSDSNLFNTAGNYAAMGIDVSRKNLYPAVALKDGTSYYFRYSVYKTENPLKFDYSVSTEATGWSNELTRLNDYLEIISHEVGTFDGIISVREPIVFLWQSSMTDFGNNLVEKTMYRANIYATKQETSNSLLLGYKTMRRFKNTEATNSIKVLDFDVNTSIANQFDLDNLGFNLFSINTFEESGMSFPLKENNFLYIQFLVKASGRVELNAIEAIYKDNRKLKSIG